jgi:hypothetical protein
MMLSEWMDELNRIAVAAGHIGHQDWDAWRDDFEAGLTPQQAWAQEWGEE